MHPYNRKIKEVQKKALASYQALLRSRVHDPRHRETFNTLKNVYTRNNLKRNVNAFAKEHSLSNNYAKSIFNSTNIVTAQKFKNNIYECLEWLHRNLGTNAYGIVLGDLSGVRAKSNLWLAHLIETFMNRGASIYLDNFTANMDIVKDGILSSIHTWVYLDDGVYSGDQLNEELKYLDERGIWNFGENTLLVAAAFATHRLDEVENECPRLKGHLKCNVYAASSMNFTEELINTISNLYENSPVGESFRVGATLTIMPHKVPDQWSFGLKRRGKYLQTNNNNHGIVPEHRIPVPYKQYTLKRLPNHMRVNPNTENVWHGFHGTYHKKDPHTGQTLFGVKYQYHPDYSNNHDDGHHIFLLQNKYPPHNKVHHLPIGFNLHKA